MPSCLTKHLRHDEAQTTWRFVAKGKPSQWDAKNLFKTTDGIVAVNVMTRPLCVDKGHCITDGYITFDEALTYAQAINYFKPTVAMSRFPRPLNAAGHFQYARSSKLLVGCADDLRVKPLKKRQRRSESSDATLTPEELERKYPGIRAVCYRHITLLKQAQQESK